jgi:hypothetical protein
MPTSEQTTRPIIDLLRDYRNYHIDYHDPECTDQAWALEQANIVQTEIIRRVKEGERDKAMQELTGERSESALSDFVMLFIKENLWKSKYLDRFIMNLPKRKKERHTLNIITQDQNLNFVELKNAMLNWDHRLFSISQRVNCKSDLVR